MAALLLRAVTKSGFGVSGPISSFHELRKMDLVLQNKTTYVTEDAGDFVRRLESHEPLLHECNRKWARRSHRSKGIAIDNPAWFEIIDKIWRFGDS
jgi:hypothetical protein